MRSGKSSHLLVIHWARYNKTCRPSVTARFSMTITISMVNCGSHWAICQAKCHRKILRDNIYGKFVVAHIGLSVGPSVTARLSVTISMVSLLWLTLGYRSAQVHKILCDNIYVKFVVAHIGLSVRPSVTARFSVTISVVAHIGLSVRPSVTTRFPMTISVC